MTQLEELLATWLPAQRWFAGKGTAIDTLRIDSDHILLPGLPGLRLLVAEVVQGSRTDRYQVLLGMRAVGAVPDELVHAVIGTCPAPADLDSPAPVVVYDAAHDAAMTGHLLSWIAENRDVGAVRFRAAPGTEVRTGLRSLVITGEQSNTSLVYGEEYVLKMFRRLWPGTNPDLELTSALATVDSPHIARPHGWIDVDLVDPASGRTVPTTLAMLQTYLRSATDGWVLAATSVRDLYASPELAPSEAGGDFAGEAQRLGAATAAVHRDLARVLPTGVLSPEGQAHLAATMMARLHTAVDEVPELAPYAETLYSAFEALGNTSTDLPVQRIHGDYHLGQVVRTDAGWVPANGRSSAARCGTSPACCGPSTTRPGTSSSAAPTTPPWSPRHGRGRSATGKRSARDTPAAAGSIRTCTRWCCARSNTTRRSTKSCTRPATGRTGSVFRWTRSRR